MPTKRPLLLRWRDTNILKQTGHDRLQSQKPEPRTSAFPLPGPRAATAFTRCRMNRRIDASRVQRSSSRQVPTHLRTLPRQPPDGGFSRKLRFASLQAARQQSAPTPTLSWAVLGAFNQRSHDGVGKSSFHRDREERLAYAGQGVGFHERA